MKCIYAYIYIFISIILIMGIKIPKSLYMIEGSYIIMFSNEHIKDTMSREWFLYILQYWHFSDSDQVCLIDNRLHKISTFVEKINRNFQKVEKLRKELTIDESMIPWHGRLKF